MRPHDTHLIEEPISSRQTQISARCLDCECQGLSYGNNPAGIIASIKTPNPSINEEAFNENFAFITTIMINHTNTNFTNKASVRHGCV